MTQHLASLDRIGLRAEPLEIASALEFVAAAEAGAINVFLGTTRAETGAADKRLTALDYEAYPEMAEQQLRDLARQARQRWPIVRMAVLHRVGRVQVGQPSVLIAVSTPHRDEAFEACRWIIDTLKAEVAIWKKEIWEDASGHEAGVWSGGTRADCP